MISQKKIERLVKHHLGTEVFLTPKMKLYQDLHIWGDDADELLIAFSQQFKVDMSKFSFKLYFPNESATPITMILFFMKLFGYKDHSKKQITISHLVDVAIRREWFDP
jgi:hypothetical protein